MTLPCGCCATAAAARERHGANRPWLSSIAYRLGTFASFRKALLDDLSRTPELRALRSRVSDDYTVVGVEMWSAVADVITFYTERIANEAFLRTATLRDSVLRLVRVIDYQLAPGAAATTALAFTLERGAVAMIPARTRVQSVPGEGETPQKYETTEPLAARAHLNRLRLVPRPAAGAPLAAGSDRAIAAPDLAAVSAVARLTPGSRVAVFASSAAEVLTVDRLEVVDDLLVVHWRQPIAGSGFQAAHDAATAGVGARAMGRTFRLFGHDAPATVVVSGLATAGDPTSAFLAKASTTWTLTPTNTLELDAKYPDLKPGATVLVVATDSGTVRAAPFTVTAVADKGVSRDAVYTKSGSATTVAGVSGTVTTLIVAPVTTSLSTIVGADIRNVVVHELIGESLRFWPYAYPRTLATDEVLIAGRRSGWATLEVGRTIEKGAYLAGVDLDLDELLAGRRVIAVDDAGGTPIATTIADADLVGLDLAVGPTPADPLTITKLGLGAGHAVPMTVLVSGPLVAPLAFAAPQREVSVTIGSIPAQTISLGIAGGSLAAVASALQTAIRAALPGSPAFSQAIVRSTESAILVAPGIPDAAVRFGPSEDDATTVATLRFDPPQARYLDGILTAPIGPLAGTSVSGQVQVRIGIAPPTNVAVTVTITTASALASALSAVFPTVIAIVRADSRILLLPQVPAREPRSWIRIRLALTEPLALDAASAGLLGNVAAASQGESVREEIVGDGDASKAFQRFDLRKKPVTYVPASVPGGIASSLQLFVNGATWTEVPPLYDAGPTAEVYTTRMSDDGVRTVQFGDGVTGARTRTGRNNIVATYRKGIGVAGRVRARTLTTLLDRPTGVKSVSNPVDADGGADSETLARARLTGPGTVRTFGRAISLRDFEDATLLAGEVAKATADWVWTGRRRVVHVTVAGHGGATFSSEKLKAFAQTLGAARDPNHPLLLGNYARVPITIGATILVDGRFVAEAVLATARAALLDALSFDRRVFAEAVDLSDIYGVLQDVPGVTAVDIDRLDLKSTDVSFRTAHGLDPGAGGLQPRLHMLPARPGSSVGAVLPAELAWIEVPPLDVKLESRGGIEL